MKKRILSIIIVLALCLTMLPAVSVPAAAAGTDTGKAIQLGASQIEGGQADSIYFGTYKQSSDGNNGYNTDPIKWRVLSNADGKLFLLSDQNLDVQPYNTEYQNYTGAWAGSSLRAWLNGTESGNFYADAFEEKEQTAIAQTTVKNADGNKYDPEISAGEDTTDKVFALSEVEAETTAYGFTDNYKATDTRKATNTDYTISRGVWRPTGYDTSTWWLRSPGKSDDYAATVNYSGYLFDIGGAVSYKDIGVRPAFNLDLSSVLFTSAADNTGHNSSFAAPTGYSGNEWKVTLKDDNDFSSGASVSGSTTLMAGYSDAALTVNHAALDSFTNAGYTNVTAMLTDTSGNILYYGSINSTTDATQSTVTIPAGLAAGKYTLSVYGEDWNGANYTNYATGTPFSTSIDVHTHNYQYAPPGYGRPYFAEVCSCGHSATATVNLPTLPSYYDGNPKTVTVTFSDNWAGAQNVTIEYFDAGSNKLDAAPTDAGSYTADITVNDNLTYNDAPFTISKVDISSAAITLGGALTYNGQEQTQTVSKVEAGGLTLTSNDYTVSGNTATNAGNHTLTVTGQGNFTGSKDVSWSIAKAPLTITAAAQIIPQGGEIDQTKYLVSGLMPGHTLDGVKLNDGGNVISVDGNSGTVLDGSNDVTGNYAITRQGGSLTRTTKTIVDIALTIPPNLTYTGEDLRGEITATAKNGDAAVPNIVPAFTFYNAEGHEVSAVTDAGEYVVEVRVDDNDALYAGTATTTFTIAKATPTGTPAYTKLSTSGKTLADAGLTTEGGTFNVPGTVAWELPETTVVAANTAYTWIFTPTDTTNYNTLSGTVKLYSVSTGGGYTPPYTPPTTSVTIPISGEENSIDVDASVSGSKATVDDVDLSKLDTVIGEDVDTGVVTIDFSGLNKDVDTVEIPSDVVKQIAEAVNNPNNDAESLEVVLSDGTSIEFDAVALGEKAAQADGLDITISIENSKKAALTTAQKNAVGGNTAYDINVTSGGKAISDMGGKITVHAPYELKSGEIPRGVVVYYIDENGNREACETSYDSVKKRVNWKTDHLSLYMIGYDEELAASCPKDETCPMAAFADVDMGAWYHDGVHYAIENDLMKGIGGNLFSPDGIITRAQIVTILHRLEGEPICGQGKSGTFGDVPDYQWYTEAVEWAAAYGIIEGYGDAQQSFGPNDPVTREQFAAILWRYAKYKGYDVSVGENTNILSYEDALTVSEYAVSAMQWACGAGIIQGISSEGGGMLLDPQGSAVRSQAAAIMMRFDENVISQ